MSTSDTEEGCDSQEENGNKHWVLQSPQPTDTSTGTVIGAIFATALAGLGLSVTPREDATAGSVVIAMGVPYLLMTSMVFWYCEGKKRGSREKQRKGQGGAETERGSRAISYLQQHRLHRFTFPSLFINRMVFRPF